MQFCDANDLESIFPGCGEQFTTYSVRKKICHLRGSNTGPSDLQSDALPAELKRLKGYGQYGDRTRDIRVISTTL